MGGIGKGHLKANFLNSYSICLIASGEGGRWPLDLIERGIKHTEKVSAGNNSHADVTAS